MKFVDQFDEILKQSFAEVFVYDERGDGHFLQMIAVDEVFEGKGLVDRSRLIFDTLGDMKQKIHAYSVKGFTPSEWKEKKEEFELIEYKHIQ